jgi:hypothetical protein
MQGMVNAQLHNGSGGCCWSQELNTRFMPPAEWPRRLSHRNRLLWALNFAGVLNVVVARTWCLLCAPKADGRNGGSGGPNRRQRFQLANNGVSQRRFPYVHNTRLTSDWPGWSSAPRRLWAIFISRPIGRAFQERQTGPITRPFFDQY